MRGRNMKYKRIIFFNWYFIILLIIFAIVVETAFSISFRKTDVFTSQINFQTGNSLSPIYPLFGIVEAHPSLNLNDLENIDPVELKQLCAYMGIYSGNKFFDKIIKSIKLQCPALEVLDYTTGFSTGKGEAKFIELNYRDAIAISKVTVLQHNINTFQTNFRVEIPIDGVLPILKSTSDVTDENDVSKYCFWIQIDNEKMKVTDVNDDNGEITVLRGFFSEKKSHKAGANVLTPVYLGNREKDKTSQARSSQGYPNSSGRNIRYRIDPGSSMGQNLKLIS